MISLSSCASFPTPITNLKSSENTANNDIKIKANDAFKSGDYIKSSELYEQIINKTPSDKESLFYYAESLRIYGNSAKALEQYNKIIEPDRNNLPAIEGKGLAFLQNGDLVSALDQFNIITKKDHSRWRTLNAIGVIYSIQGKNEDALQYYNLALETSHNNPSIINNIALGVAFSGDNAKGISLLNNAIASMPEEGIKKQRLENNLALLYGISGKMDEAEKILRKNLPEPAVYNNLGFYAKISANKELAWEYLSKAIASSPVYYEKAENNLQGLGGQPDETSTPENTTDDTKIEAVKAKRGTHKLPLPSFRP